ncbi:ABC transporter spermidine/putrescine permease [[Clostridium] sordellii]|uniref:ABC-type transport system,spermidine/putrescine permease n=1 Tax=Paraclostridium sordellii TaxID=1505 RepID=A0ABP1XZH7_PARSO|nr:ABC transporter permease [Paeniclostridium sordellii]CEJ75317.1 ABC-type transport system,spermidine/putrescine permease [[Clostridium] sordellii] [Paeniclostridium sordellii]CEN71222.1 ABC transporter spermidine/putrescine permease [[Clostridium] sordellii] [Paeniclostridium sordellii]CEN71264.1 ABC transporter spermidine/putrescine permease [[Clostridium] sordellii] [Paeniclostridium sordellii]CEO31156.1 ABC transporter spermidine/putrescine permease [[Clostridium] sordellii] [Paeniclostri
MKKNKSFLAYPYIIWSALFIVIPLILMVVFSFTIEDGNKIVFSLDNYQRLMNPIYLKVFLRSIILAGASTIICLLVGYPVAYIISKAHISKRNTLILLFILPMWMNFLLRTYAWVAILGKNGILNSFLGLFGIEPVTLLYTNFAILLGMVYNFLPFMVLPIYTSLSKMDNDLINAAKDLGANSFQVFTKVIFPLSIPGVVSGITMVFMPAVTTFAISRLLGGGKFMLLGDLIEQQFTVVGDWNFGSAISIFMMIIILISMAIMSRFEDDSDKEGGGLLF